MEQWLEWARGPLFRFAFLIMVLGLARHIVLTGVGIFRAMRRAGNKSIPYGQVFVSTLAWLFPLTKLRNRFLYSMTSILFHLGLILTPIFLVAHIVLWKRGFGFGWPGFSQQIADVLTLLTIAAGIGLIIGRLASRQSRHISRFQDFALPPLLLVPFISGFLAMHPSLNPFSYNAVMLVHVMSGNLIFVLIPFTKLSHAILLPASQLVSEVGWHFPADSGKNVGLALNKESPTK